MEANFFDPMNAEAYDLVICDGQALCTQGVAEYRKRTEQTRLINSQLILGLQRIKTGGMLIVLLHKPYKWGCVKLLYTFSHFSDFQLFKLRRYHAEKSSFYLVVSVLAEFGPAFTELARPVWAIQAAALREARWMRKYGTEENTSEREVYQNCESINEGPAKSHTASESSFTEKL